MSAFLPSRAKALRSQLARIQALGAGVEEAGRLEGLRADLEKPVEALKQHLEDRDILTRAGLDVPLAPSLEAGRQRTKALLDKFVEEPKAATLKKGRSWSQALTDAASASQIVGQAATAAWRKYRDELFGGDKPSVIGARVAPTPENTKALADYERLYKAYRELFDALPADMRTIERARDLAARLVAISKTFDFNVPDDVKAFLKAIQEGGAPLPLLTEEVRDWLRDRHATDDYRIRAKSAS